MKNLIKFIIAGTVLFCPLLTKGQSDNGKKEFLYSNRISLQTGLLQDLVLGGKNIVISYNTKRLVFDWSHGASLDFKSGHHLGNNESYNKQKLNVHVPWTTGPSIGYRVTQFFNVRAEFKAHRNEVSNAIDHTSVARYTTYTVGVGAFYEWYPFRKKNNWLQGVLIEPVMRFWPNVGSSKTNNFTYNNSATGRVEKLDDYNLGLLYNINIGYTFGGK